MIAGQNDRDQLVAERNALRLALAEMTAMVGVLESLPKVQHKAEEPAEEAVDQTPRRRKDTIAFWDRVMQEIADLMEDRVFTAKEIFRLLDDDTAREASRWTDKTWGPGVLADKMRGRAKEGRFFVEPKRDYFRSRSAAAQAAFANPDSATLAATLAEAPPMQVVATPKPKVTGVAPEVPTLSSLKMLSSVSADVQDEDDIPEDLVCSMVGWASEDADARDAWIGEDADG